MLKSSDVRQTYTTAFRVDMKINLKELVKKCAFEEYHLLVCDAGWCR
jgi:hypothetical protein